MYAAYRIIERSLIERESPSSIKLFDFDCVSGTRAYRIDTSMSQVDGITCPHSGRACYGGVHFFQRLSIHSTYNQFSPLHEYMGCCILGQGATVARTMSEGCTNPKFVHNDCSAIFKVHDKPRSLNHGLVLLVESMVVSFCTPTQSIQGSLTHTRATTCGVMYTRVVTSESKTELTEPRSFCANGQVQFKQDSDEHPTKNEVAGRAPSVGRTYWL